MKSDWFLVTAFRRTESGAGEKCMDMKKNKLAIVGCGKLGSIVADALLSGLLPEYELAGVYSRTMSKAEALASRMIGRGLECRVCAGLDELIALNPDYIVEAASPAAMKELAIPALSSGASIVTLSIGALADEKFRCSVEACARENGARVYVVSGATGGFDVLRTASLMGGAEAEFFNEKGPDALRGTPVYEDSLQTEQRTVFSGSASEAIALFPTKVNVAVAASLASVGPDRMRMSMRSTPGFKGDTQRVEIRNAQVHAVVDVYSATSEIAAWSVVSTLQNIVSPISFC